MARDGESREEIDGDGDNSSAAALSPPPEPTRTERRGTGTARGGFPSASRCRGAGAAGVLAVFGGWARLHGVRKLQGREARERS